MRTAKLLLKITVVGVCITLFVYIGLIGKTLGRGKDGGSSIDWSLARRDSESGLEEMIRSMERQVQEIRRAWDGCHGNMTANALRDQQADRGEQSDLQVSSTPCRQQNGIESPPSLESEMARRRVEYLANTMGYYVSLSLKDLKYRAGTNVRLTNMIYGINAGLQELQNALAHSLRHVDRGEDWRKAESERLGELVQNRLHRLQNPSDCSQARYIVCNLRQACGYGCLLHHACYCLFVAYATNRTFMLQDGSRLFGQHTWESIFQPLSDKCDRAVEPVIRWGDNTTDWKNAQSLFLPLLSQLNPKPAYLPLAIPADLASRLKVFHGDPPVWWLGQLLRYLTRPNSRLRRHMNIMAEKIGFQSPIVGLHIRRTDKLVKEAHYHSLEDYMIQAEAYFRKLEHNGSVRRRVYMATDDPNVLAEARKSYPRYVFLGDKNASRLAGLDTRNSYASLVGIILDTYFLSRSDFLVCTFSSNVCRAAYELKQTYTGDASNSVHSLDKRFYFHGQHDDSAIAVEKHIAESTYQVSFETGDRILLQGNDLSGIMSRGLNLRTGQSGMFPTYKTVKEVAEVHMPAGIP